MAASVPAVHNIDNDLQRGAWSPDRIMTVKVPKVRLVADTNYLTRKELREFLAASRLHYVVLTEFAAIESYKGDTLRSIFPNMAVLAEYSRQVIVLKGAELTQSLIDRVSNPQLRLIDPAQTAGFPRFAEALRNPNPRIRRELLKKGAYASAHMERMIGDASSLARVLPDVLSIYNQTEQRFLRKQTSLPNELARKVMQQIMVLAATRLRSARVRRAPSFDELLDTLIFRESVCTYIWSLRTMQGTYPTNPLKIRNSVVDCSFAAYATFFDGLLTAEPMPMDVYRTAMHWLMSIRNAN